ncbi:MAG TPA: hypothetical protein VF624_06095 [Tepidisphaeraceae bacterium]
MRRIIFVISSLWGIGRLALAAWMAVIFFHPEWFEPGQELDILPFFFLSVILLFFAGLGAVVARMTTWKKTRHKSFRLTL